ncbi:MAG: glycosyltransferase [Candidatus Ratteibacteria bacterium]|jgi:glycosyltransferase involved in cell wall biosynthesis
MKKIVISGINFHSGGPLAIYHDILKILESDYSDKYEIIALVHSAVLFEKYKKIKFLEFNDSAGNYFKRFYYEYFYFKKLSRKLNPYLWISLHDITPNVQSTIQAVYCHNPSPFYRCTLKELVLDPKFFLFTIFYKYIYKINVTKNNYVIVQQDWIRQQMVELFKIPKDKIIAAVPNPAVDFQDKTPLSINSAKANYVFFYPALPRVFKNFEIIGEASKILLRKGLTNFKIYLTIDGNENRYAKYVFNKYGKLKNIDFIGLQTRDTVFEYYSLCDCLLFPSKLETWGLPISEIKIFKKPIIVPDLPYAYETIGDYEKVLFFDPSSPRGLANAMEKAIKGTFGTIKSKKIREPYVKSWKELINYLVGHQKND